MRANELIDRAVSERWDIVDVERDWAGEVVSFAARKYNLIFAAYFDRRFGNLTSAHMSKQDPLGWAGEGIATGQNAIDLLSDGVRA